MSVIHLDSFRQGFDPKGVSLLSLSPEQLLSSLHLKSSSSSFDTSSLLSSPQHIIIIHEKKMGSSFVMLCASSHLFSFSLIWPPTLFADHIPYRNFLRWWWYPSHVSQCLLLSLSLPLVFWAEHHDQHTSTSHHVFCMFIMNKSFDCVS